jgi:hypothetical protein
VANLDSFPRPVRMITVTAPGVAGGLPWSTVTPGKVDMAARFRWNRSAPRRWRDMHRLAGQRTRRRGCRLTMLARMWQYQKRGVLHMHVVVACGSPAERRAADIYQAELVRLAGAHGFGWVDRKRDVREAAHAGRYLASYLVGGKNDVRETVREPDVPPLVLYVSRTLTSRTLVTMRTLRLRRLAWVLGHRDEVPWWQVLAALVGLEHGQMPPMQLVGGSALLGP